MEFKKGDRVTIKPWSKELKKIDKFHGSISLEQYRKDNKEIINHSTVYKIIDIVYHASYNHLFVLDTEIRETYWVGQELQPYITYNARTGTIYN